MAAGVPYVDPDFPAEVSSLYVHGVDAPHRYRKSTMDALEWKRASEIYS